MGWSPDRNALQGRVAVVAGATRGAGRGIATALGEAGATVVCTGRTTRTQRSEYDRAETIEETAEMVTDLGGTGVAIALDHLDAEQVRRLAERIRNDYGHIDVLVNDIWGAEILKGGPDDWNTPIWEHDLDTGLRILRLAIDTHLITSHHLLPLLIRQPGGLLVEVTDGTNDYNASTYRISVYYDLAKVAVNRLAFSQGHELAPFGATAVAVTPGWMRSEIMLDAFGVSEENWRDAAARLPASRSPSRPVSSGAQSSRSRRTPTGSDGTRSRSPRENSHSNMDSPTSTVRGPTSGATSPTPASPRSKSTSTTTASENGDVRHVARRCIAFPPSPTDTRPRRETTERGLHSRGACVPSNVACT